MLWIDCIVFAKRSGSVVMSGRHKDPWIHNHYHCWRDLDIAIADSVASQLSMGNSSVGIKLVGKFQRPMDNS